MLLTPNLLQQVASFMLVLGFEIATVSATNFTLPVVDMGYAIHQAHLSIVSQPVHSLQLHANSPEVESK